MKTLIPQDILRWRTAGYISMAPGSSRLAFVEAWSDEEKNTNHTAVWLLDLEDPQPRRITFGPTRDWAPKWSPDGQRLAFLSVRETDWRSDLYVLDMQGGDATLVAKLPRGIEDFAWSPDGKSFALTGKSDYPPDPKKPEADIEERRKSYGERVARVSRLHYRADGAGLKDDDESCVWVCPTDGGDPKRIVEARYPLSQPGWTPDGEVCFLSSREDDYEFTWNLQLWSVSASGGEPTQISKAGGPVSAYRFNKSGSLALLAYPVPGLPVGCHEQQLHIDGAIVSDELDGTPGKHVLAETLDLLAWSGTPLTSDGDDFYFPVSKEGAVHLFRFRNGKFEKVVDGNRVIGEIAVAGDNIVFTSTSPDDTGSIRVCSLDGTAEKVIHDPNPWIREVEIAECRELWVTTGDVRSQAWVLLPPGKDPQNLPTILGLHGGPHGAYGWSFNLQFQILSAGGYAVVFGNPPGSLTYGEQFAQLTHRAWGEADFPSCMEYLDELERQGVADADRLGVTGASYGGFLTLWTVGHTDRFKAAVAARPPANLESEFGSSEFGWSLMHSCFGSHPWEEPDLFRRLSPLRYASEIKTPLRLISCTRDYRVPMEQAEQVYITLKVLGRTTDLVIFPESHMLILSGKPWNRADHMDAILEWFVKYLPADKP